MYSDSDIYSLYIRQDLSIDNYHVGYYTPGSTIYMDI